MEFHQKLSQALLVNAMSVNELATRTGLSRTSCYRWASGQSVPSINDALALARVLGTPLEWLADPGMLEPPGPEPGLTQDEETVLEVYRSCRDALGFGWVEAVRALAVAAQWPRTEGEPNELVLNVDRPGVVGREVVRLPAVAPDKASGPDAGAADGRSTWEAALHAMNEEFRRTGIKNPNYDLVKFVCEHAPGSSWTPPPYREQANPAEGSVLKVTVHPEVHEAMARAEAASRAKRRQDDAPPVGGTSKPTETSHAKAGRSKKPPKK